MKLSLAAAPLTGCQSFDSWFFQLERGIKDRVVIIGAGIAGLTLAFELKKKGIPFRIFEASQRIGGRIYTLDSFNSTQQKAELGAEWFNIENPPFKNLVQELKLETQAVANIAKNQFFFTGDKWIPISKLEKEIQILYQQLARLAQQMPEKELDRASLADTFKNLNSKVSDAAMLWLERIVQHRWGADPDQISSLFVMRWLDSLGPKPLNYFQKWNTKISGGSQILVQALYDRLVGVLPQEVIRFDHELVEVNSSQGSCQFFFKTEKGPFEIQALDGVICLPFSQLKKIKGLDQAFSEEKQRLALTQLNSSQLSKAVLSYKEKFWTEPIRVSKGLGLFEAQQMWDSSAQSVEPLKSSRGILSFQVGGRKASQMNPALMMKMQKEIQQSFNPKVPSEVEKSHLQNWSQYPSVQGGSFFYSPGQFLKFSKINWNSKESASLYLAGDYLDPIMGATVDASIDSALKVSNMIYEKRQNLKKKSTVSI